MKRYLVITGAAVLAAVFLTAKADSWKKIYGGSNNETGFYVQQTTDGGYFVVGDKYPSYNMGDVWLLKIDSSGDTLWTKTYGTPTCDDEAFSGQQTADGGYIIVGYTESFGAGKRDIWLLKTNSSGDTVWTRTFGRPGYNRYNDGYSIQQTKDGGYIIIGDWRDTTNSQPVPLLLKTDANGETLWTRTYGKAGSSGPYGVRQTNDGGYIIACTGYASDSGIDRACLIKTDSLGDTVWTWRDTVGYRCVQEVSDGSYVTAGMIAPPGKLALATVDKDGKSLWEKFHGNPTSWGSDVKEAKDKGFIITGLTQIRYNSWALWLLKTNSNGDTLWSHKYSQTSQSLSDGRCVCPTSDGGYIITGQTVNPATNGDALWLIKTDSMGMVAVKEGSASPQSSNWKLVSSIGKKIIIEYADSPRGIHASIFNAFGRKVDELNKTGSAGYIAWGDGHSAGVYFMRCQLNNSVATNKIILVK
jgi:hypothetical protein